MNGIQKEIYNWLLKKPSYIKKSADWLFTEGTTIPDGGIADYQIALKEARKVTKQSVAKKPFKDTVWAKKMLEIGHKHINKPKTINIITSPNLDPNNVLIIGDTHNPFTREGYLEHNIKIQKDYKCGTIVHIGDVIDNSYSSFHETNPDGHSAGDELDYAIESLQPWFKAFPNVKVCLGNHDLIINRKAFSAGLSKRWIKGLGDVLGAPNWNFDIEHVVHDVLYTHGTGTSGQNSAYNRAINRRMSVVQGHLHSEASIRFNVSQKDIIFGMQVGCGVDEKKYAFDYAKANPRKFIISSGAVLNKGKNPILIPMEL
jgi:predicted phosphodiesterase